VDGLGTSGGHIEIQYEINLGGDNKEERRIGNNNWAYLDPM
jgi:hypothetical protein